MATYFFFACTKESKQRKVPPVKSLIFALFQFFYGNFLNSQLRCSTDENCLKIESRKGDLYGT